MRSTGVALLTLLSLAACGALPAAQATPYLPPGVFGVYEDNDIGAINFAAWAFASPANTAGRPLDAMKAVIAVEYLPGELQENPRWIAIGRDPRFNLAQARRDVRQALGIRPDAPPQMVVNVLLNALATGDQAGTLRALSSPIFLQPPDQTLARFARMPYVQSANLATSRLSDAIVARGAGGF
jgi:hypothetical protein